LNDYRRASGIITEMGGREEKATRGASGAVTEGGEGVLDLAKLVVTCYTTEATLA
jgi:hypothetical protein